MWLLFQEYPNCDDEWYCDIMRFCGAYETQIAAFEAAMKLKYNNCWAPHVAIVEYTVGTKFDGNLPVQYIATGEFVIEIRTGYIVYGDSKILELHGKLMDCDGKKDLVKYALNYGVYDHIHYGDVSLKNKNFVYGLTYKDALAIINAAVNKNDK